MLISTFNNIQTDKISVYLVKQSSSVGDVAIAYGGVNNIYMTWDEVLYLIQKLDDLLATKDGLEQLFPIEGEA